MEEKLNIDANSSIINIVESDINHLVNSSENCLFCGDVVETEFKIETLNQGYIGSFCSQICSSSSACHISNLVALRETTSLQLLPLYFYKNQESIRRLIKKTKDCEAIFGGHEKISKDKVYTSIKQFNF
ncbi:late transcription factor VLTF-2 [Carp edema virus]|nr:late transcription factor VLTF-2 [Carp edema virus]